ncbi:MAG: hypothetical protein OEU50_20560 [Gammaproteobacteria bacterium]|nr:hypothetical protein [Gammaproteobacteria bacterium]
MNAKTILGILLTVSLCLSYATGQAQQTTEKFIPIGMSPGVSGKSTYQGNITEVNVAAKSFSMQIDGDNKVISLAPTTRIWLDRSKSKKPNLDGEPGALESGSKVEVMMDPKDPSKAAWIKIEAN